MSKRNRNILRELAGQVGEIAGLPIQEEKRRLWRGLNGLKPERPMVSHDKAETKRRMDFASWLFDGVMPLREEGYDPYIAMAVAIG